MRFELPVLCRAKAPKEEQEFPPHVRIGKQCIRRCVRVKMRREAAQALLSSRTGASAQNF